jgi:hypothetical protein
MIQRHIPDDEHEQKLPWQSFIKWEQFHVG